VSAEPTRSRSRGLTARGRARHGPRRLPSDERREAIIDAALSVFAATSYSGATTAAIAREAGVSEPILYRHFPSKRDLYLACLDAAWHRLSAAIEEESRALGQHVGLAHIAADPGLRRLREQLSSLWVVALTESGEDAVIGARLRDHLREVHDLIETGFEVERARGTMPPDRDAYAEAWVSVAGALLLTVAERLGGLLGPDDLARISRSRKAWLLPDAPLTRDA
jgi:AcrR family transcriptional regulator